jgi:hypothetical protein
VPETANQRLFHEAVAHSINLSRYGAGVVRQIIGLLNATDDRLTAALAAALAQVEPSSFTVGRLESLLGSVREINAAAYRAAFGAIPGEMRTLADYEAAYQVDLLANVLPGDVQLEFQLFRVSVDQVYAAAISRPFQGGLLKDWAASAEANRLTTIRNAIRSGFVEGRTTDQIIRDIRGTKAKGYRDGRLDGSRRGLAAIVQTALSHTAETAREEVYEANGDVIKAARWVSTLDTQTSPPCRLRDGLLYTADKAHKPIGHKVPWLAGPGRLHFCCRSVSSPVTKSFRELGLDIDEIGPGTRASMDGQVAADLTYGDWLKKQSAARQDEILGPARAALMRKGGLPFDSFYSPRGEVLTLDQLRQRDAAAFRKAGLDQPEPKSPPPSQAPKPAAPTLAEINAKHDRDMRAYTLTEGRKSGTEHLVVYDAATGKAYAPVSDGKKSSVAFPPWLLDELRNPQNQLVLHHNHPSSGSLSKPDLMVLASYPGARSIWAHGHNGSSYYAEPAKKPITSEAYNIAFNETQGWLQGLIRTGQIATQDAIDTFHHAILLLLAKRGVVNYQADLQGASLAAFQRARPLIDEYLSNA